MEGDKNLLLVVRRDAISRVIQEKLVKGLVERGYAPITLWVYLNDKAIEVWNLDCLPQADMDEIRALTEVVR